MGSNLLKSTAVVSLYTFLSRILGFARDMVFARIFGAGEATDAFFVAFKVPNFMRRLFAEGAFSQAFVPVLSEYKTQKEHAEVKALVDRVSAALGLVLFGITLIGVVAAPIMIMIFAPGFISAGEKYDLAVELLRLTFPYLFFISLTALAGGILNAYGNFAVPAFTPVLLNVCMISAALFLAPYFEQPIMALAWGVFIAGAVQLLFQLPFLARLKLLPKPRLDFRDSGVRKIGKLMLPAIFGSSVAQINLLLDTLIASFLITGSVSWLYYSDRLLEFPLGIFGIALATVILPHLSKKHAAESKQEFSDTLDWSLRWACIIGIPATLGLFILASPLLTTLFQYGAFSQHDVLKATQSLHAYSIGLMGFIFIKILVTGFFSRQDTKTPVKIGVIAMVSNMALNIILVFPLAHAGLALATTLSAFINAGLLFWTLKKQSVLMFRPGWPMFLLRLLLANGALAALLLFAVQPIEVWFAWSAVERVSHLMLWIGIAVVGYFSVLWLSGLRLVMLKSPLNG